MERKSKVKLRTKSSFDAPSVDPEEACIREMGQKNCSREKLDPKDSRAGKGKDCGIAGGLRQEKGGEKMFLISVCGEISVCATIATRPVSENERSTSKDPKVNLLSTERKRSIPIRRKQTAKVAKKRIQPERVARLPKTPFFNDFCDSDTSLEKAIERAKDRGRKRRFKLEGVEGDELSDPDSDDSTRSAMIPIRLAKQLGTRNPNKSCKKFLSSKLAPEKEDMVSDESDKMGTANIDMQQDQIGYGAIVPAFCLSSKSFSSSSNDDASCESHIFVDSRYEERPGELNARLYTPPYLNDRTNPKNDPNFFGYLEPQTLAVGDILHFCAIEGTAGMKCWERRATIVGFQVCDSKTEYPLVLEPMHLLPWAHLVKRMASKVVEESYHRPIENFVFIGNVGEQNHACSFTELADKGRRAREDIRKASDEWWKKTRNPTK